MLLSVLRSPLRPPLRTATAPALGNAGGSSTAVDFTQQATLTAAGFYRSGVGRYTNSAGNNVATTETAPSSGLWLPRITHNPDTLAALGTLIEPAATNNAPTTETLADWTAGGVTISTSSQLSPDGVTNSRLLTEDTSGIHRIFIFRTWTAGVQYFSFFAKPNGRSRIFIYADGGLSVGIANLTTRAHTVVNGAPTATFETAANGFVRVDWRWNQTTTTNQSFQVWLDNGTTENYTGNGVSGAYLWGLQLSLVGGSYIQNNTSGTASRNVDGDWDYSGDSFTSIWGGGSERTIVLEWQDTGSTLERMLAMGHVSGSVASEAHGVYVNASNALIMYAKAGGSVQAALTAGTIKAGTPTAPARNRVAFRWGGGSFGVSLNGAAEVTGSGTVPSVTHLRIAGAGLVAANGTQHILTSIETRATAQTGSAAQALSNFWAVNSDVRVSVDGNSIFLGYDSAVTMAARLGQLPEFASSGATFASYAVSGTTWRMLNNLDSGRANAAALLSSITTAGKKNVLIVAEGTNSAGVAPRRTGAQIVADAAAYIAARKADNPALYVILCSAFPRSPIDADAAGLNAALSYSDAQMKANPASVGADAYVDMRQLTAYSHDGTTLANFTAYDSWWASTDRVGGSNDTLYVHPSGDVGHPAMAALISAVLRSIPDNGVGYT